MTGQAGALGARLSVVKTRIERACARARRDPATVRLLAVSKRHSAESIRELYQVGQRDFGENYAQELVEKAEALRDFPDLRWHFIGHFQRNKAGMLAPHCHLLHTLDSARAARALGRRAAPQGGPLSVMLQVNVGREAQKAGVDPDEAAEVLAEVRQVDGVRLLGLMTLPPAGDPSAARACYAQLATLAAEHGLPELSMGMSADLEIAVACGATWVRVGTDLFGPRG